MQTTYFGASVLMKVLLAQGVMSGLALFVNVLIAIGTIGAVIVALFGNWLRFRLFPPILNIRLLDPEGEGPLPVTDANGGVLVGFARWYHFRVSNGRRWIPLTDVDVRLLQIDELGPGAIGWRMTWKAEAPIQCRNQKSYPQRHTIGSDLDFDICRVMSTGKLHLTPLFPANNLNTLWTGQCDLKLTFQAKSSEIDSRIIVIRITWDGTWHDGTTEMQQRFKIWEEKEA